MERRETPQDRYVKKNIVAVNIHLNRKTDADILEYLSDKSKQTEIKRCLRFVMAHESQTRPTD